MKSLELADVVVNFSTHHPKNAVQAVSSAACNTFTAIVTDLGESSHQGAAPSHRLTPRKNTPVEELVVAADVDRGDKLGRL